MTSKKTNTLTAQQIDDRIDEIGTLVGKADTALVDLGVEIARWAVIGAIPNVNPPARNATGDAAINYIERYYERFVTARQNAGYDTRTEGSKSSQVSKLRAFALLGAKMETAPDFLQQVRDKRNEYDPTKCKAAYTALLSAIAKLNKNSKDMKRTCEELTKEEIIDAVLKKAAPDKTELKFFESVSKQFETAANSGLLDTTSELLTTAINAINARVSQLHDEVELMNWIDQGDKFAEKGMIVPVNKNRVLGLTPAELIKADELATPAEKAIAA